MNIKSKETLINSIKETLNNSLAEYNTANYSTYKISYINQIKYVPDNERETIIVNFLFGTENANEDNPEVYEGNLTLFIWSEIGADASVTRFIFNDLYKKYKRTRFTSSYINELNNEEYKYYYYARTSDLSLLDAKLASGNSFRSYYTMSMSYLVSEQYVFNTTFKIKIGSAGGIDDDSDDVTLYGFKDSRNLGITPYTYDNGNLLISTNDMYNGSFCLVLTNDNVSKEFFKILHRQSDITEFSLRITNCDFDYTEENLRIGVIALVRDDATGQMALSIQFYQSFEVDEIKDYQDGYDDGYFNGKNEGYKLGYSDGESVSQETLTSKYNEGYNDGENTSNQNYYDNGYTAGQNSAKTTYYNKGYADAKEKYESSDYSKGYTDGYDTAKKQYENSGYSSGYNAGYKQGYNSDLDSELDPTQIQEAAKDLIYKMFKNGMSITEIIQYTGYTYEQVEQVIQEQESKGK